MKPTSSKIVLLFIMQNYQNGIEYYRKILASLDNNSNEQKGKTLNDIRSWSLSTFAELFDEILEKLEVWTKI